MILKASICLFLLFFCNKCSSLREYSKEDILRLREEVREMFQHAYDSYLRYAYPYDELRPLSCDGVDTWGSYSLTLIDALDTLAIMGNYTEFNRVVDILLQKKNFDSDINVSVFETNIRITGGLLSAHLLSYKTGAKLEPGWPCNGPLLRLAEDVAQRLIAAFDTTTGMPYGTINLRSGVPPGETSVTCTAGVGTFIIEFGTLSRLTGDPLYEEVALNALKALYHHRSPIGLVGNHIDVMTGRWTAQDAGIGGGVDSYYEYLVKGAILLEKPELMSMFLEARQSIDRYLRKDDWFVWATMLRGHVTLPVFQSLESYYPGLLSLIGESDTAMRIIHNYHSVWKQYGFTPEVYNLGTGEASTARESYPLRPELIESIMYLYRDTRDPILLQMGEDILRSIQHSAKTNCGYATIKDVRDHRKEDRMESFFLAETTKYLYLLFDPDNFIHNPGVHGTVINTPNGECVVDVGGYIFNTEAHPIDPTMLHCCHEAKQGINISEVHRVYQLLEEEDNIKFMTLIEASENKKNNNKTENVKNTQVVVEETSNVTTEGVLVENKIDQNQVLIKTETRTGYVNIDGTERENIINESSLTEIVKEKLSKYYNGSLLLAEADDSETVTDENSTDTDKPVDKDVEVDDIIVASQDPDTLQPPSSSRAKEAYKLLPKAIQEFLNNDWKTRPKCEPQRILERIRRENKYPEHMDVDAYELLLTPAPSFLQRISLAGEFLSKKQMQT
ncbi:ER degradation-enhancing alpha-mannosidase-like protein 2 isoform X3 [Ostrinia furnacalis]|uniref:ER degradation-enhancing alpha-mannosidase-like protein 2 isoform X2 n=1 Tax=Ostrinia furnacalis TaxID=93504 RepID=UPI001040C481|nr:ER degradation-enhancing alpha-mannosidase-like protein 2 isoform X2 [Ostrinia furnacalis]XP_028163873.1 ER degradation-enhancing alpha-mannosidase-like protein 2 isoform X3 [Ostrinia furnacalis]